MQKIAKITAGFPLAAIAAVAIGALGSSEACIFFFGASCKSMGL